MELRWRNIFVWCERLLPEIMQLQNKLPSYYLLLLLLGTYTTKSTIVFYVGIQWDRLLKMECSIVCQNNNYPLECSPKLLKRTNSNAFILLNGKYTQSTHKHTLQTLYANAHITFIQCNMDLLRITMKYDIIYWNDNIFNWKFDIHISNEIVNERKSEQANGMVELRILKNK